MLMARSRIPVISGELLRGMTRFPSIFVILNAMVLVLLFIGALGVNGETRPRYTPMDLTNVTSFYGDETLFGYGDNPLENELRPAAYSCSNRTSKTITFWPTAFNISRDGSRPHNVSCQYGDQYRPEKVEPLLRMECVNVRNDASCSLNAVKPFVFFNASYRFYGNMTSTGEWRGIRYKSIKTTYKLGNITSGTGVIAGTQGTVILFDEYPDGSKDAIFIFNDTSRQSFALAYGSAPTSPFLSGLGRFWMHPPIQVTPSTLISNSTHFLNAIHNSRPQIVREMGESITMLLEYWLAFSYSTKPLDWTSYTTEHDKEGTEISISAIVLFTLLISVSISFVLFEAILVCILVRKKKIKMCELRSNDFDHFSKSVQNAFERQANVDTSKSFVSIGAQADEHNVLRVGLVLPSSH